MDRRTFIAAAAAAGALGAERTVATAADALEPGMGPHVLVDDYLIESTSHLRRVVQHPVCQPAPVLDSATFGVTQPYLSVVRDGDRFRIWYNRGPEVWHAQSRDGVRWRDPRPAWPVQRGYGVTVIDDRAREPDPARRYKLANWQSNREWDDTPRDNGGMFVGFSPDGLDWTPYAENPVLRTYPIGWPHVVKHGVGDTVDAFWDPVRSRYAAAVKVHALPSDGYAPAPKSGKIFRRLIGMTTSTDFLRWERPWRILVPDDRDEGLLEFYGMGGVHAVGPLLIGLARVLRDDLPCDPGGPVDGIGYTVLAWSRDGVRWERDREPLLDRSSQPGSWDHAMAWGSAAVEVGDDLLLYYGGYARGHKIEAAKERQIGMARLPRGRYVARVAGATVGTIRTRLLRLPGGELYLNFRAPAGEIQVRVLDPDGRAMRGFGWRDGAPLRGDGLRERVRWRNALADLQGRTVRLELRLRQAELFALELA